MALRPIVSPSDLTQRVPRGAARRERPQHNRSVGESIPGLDISISKRWFIALGVALPLMIAATGFVGSSLNLPKFPKLLTEPTERGTILSADGVVLGEGDAQSRSYPQGELAANIIGFSGAEQPDHTYGLEGLERMLDRQLQAGQNITLTLDTRLQSIVQNELDKTAKLNGASDGAMVLLEAKTGRVVASASYPTYDPNTQSTLEDRSAIQNLAFNAMVEPGSVMKPFVVASLLQAGKLQPHEVLPVAPTRRVGDKTFEDVAAHEPYLAVRDILRYSSNVGMIEIGNRFSSAELAAWYQKFGFGHPVNIRYADNAPGILHPAENWVPQDHASAVIGQSMSATALQLATAYSILANDGLYITPQIVADEVGKDAPYRVLDARVARTVRNMLSYTVKNSSLQKAEIPGVRVAGKSGSADLYDTEKGAYIDAGTLSFAGMFPAQNPQLIGVLYLQRVKQKGALSASITAPAFRRIGSQAVALWTESQLAAQ